MNKFCFILRGLPGAGKSSLAELLHIFTVGAVFSADNYFTRPDGSYNFDIGQIGDAHDWCFDKFVGAVDYGKTTIIVDNTNCRESEFLRYKEYAEANGYTVFVLLVENWHGNKSVHNVPETTLTRREALLRNSIRLR